MFLSQDEKRRDTHTHTQNVSRAQEKRLVASAATFRGSINGETDETNGNSSAKRIQQPKPAALDMPQLNTFFFLSLSSSLLSFFLQSQLLFFPFCF